MLLLVVPVLLAPLLSARTAGAVSGGTALPVAQAPYVAWLAGRCTGTLISPTRILTAGHCLAGKDKNGYQVVLGVDGGLATPSELAAHAVAVKGFAVDPHFREAFPFAHHRPENAIAIDDVGVILLKHPVKGIAPVPLGTAAPGAPVTLAGYGLTAPPGAATPLRGLQQGALTVIDPAACRRAYPHAVRPAMICAQDLAGHAPPLVQACAGDSGGPVLASTPAGTVQVGITSWGPETMDGACGEKPLPAVEMRASAYTTFIRSAAPAIEPYSLGSDASRISGTARVGRAVSCRHPRLGGGRARFTYSWQVTANLDEADIRGAHGAKLRVTAAVYRRADSAKRLFCTATAHNRGGSVAFQSSSVALRR
jgi:hypothetical protein